MTVETDKLQVQDYTELFEDPDGNGIFRNTDTGVSLTLDQVAKLSGGRVEIPDGNLRLGTGQAIEDGSGTERVQFRSNDTIIRDPEYGNIFVGLSKDSYGLTDTLNLAVDNNQPLVISDENRSFNAVEYTTSASGPGTLSLPNADLDVRGNNITNAGSVSTDDLSVNNVGARIQLSSDQIIPDTTQTKVGFDTVVYDDAGEFDTTNNEFVASDAGKYLIISTITWSSDSGWSTGDVANAGIFVNGSQDAFPNTVKVGTSGQTAYTQVVADLSSGGVIDFRAFQNSGVDKVVNSTPRKTYATISQVG